MIRQSQVRVAVPLAVLTVLAGPAACGTGSAGRDVAMTASVSAADRDWLTETHRSGLAEIQYGRLAQRKGVTAAVRKAGSMLATGHSAFDEKLTRSAERLHVDLPESPGAERLAVARRLENESGSRFDHDFTTTTIEEHRKAIAATEAEVREGSSPEVTGLAREVLPDLRHHLAMLRRASPVG